MKTERGLRIQIVLFYDQIDLIEYFKRQIMVLWHDGSRYNRYCTVKLFFDTHFQGFCMYTFIGRVPALI